MTIIKVFVRKLLLVAYALLLVGCATPKNAEEFRQAVRNGPFKLVETFEVARPFNDVSATLRKKSAECLDVTINWNTEFGRYKNTTAQSDTFKPTFTANSKKAELHLQRKSTGSIDIGSPPDGNYRIVLDATPIAKNRTRIDTYILSIDDKLNREALRGWVRGDNLGCPDLRAR